MTTEKFVVIGDRLVPWPEVSEARRARASEMASELSAPMIIRDHLDGVQNPCDGKIYDSKSAYYRAVKDAGCVIVGDMAEKLAAQPSGHYHPVTRDEIGESVKKVKSGYKPKLEYESED